MELALRDCSFVGPALPEPYVKLELLKSLRKKALWRAPDGREESKAEQLSWDAYRRKLKQLGEQGGERRVFNHVIEPLRQFLGYAEAQKSALVETREGREDGGWVLRNGDGTVVLRAWSVECGDDLDAPNQRGRAYRFSPARVAHRVLLANGERVGLLTDGDELRLLLCDPARTDSHIAISLNAAGGWRSARGVPDSMRLLVALASPEGVSKVAEITDEARLAQSKVTSKLRQQARRAIEDFLQELLDNPANAAVLAQWKDQDALARELWREGLVMVYRLLFTLKLESSPDPARAFSFASSTVWRRSYSPTSALAKQVRAVLDRVAESGELLESGLRTLFKMFAAGVSSSELEVKPLGGMLFGEQTAELLHQLHWGEQAVARLLDHLLWTPGDGKIERQRVHYGTLDVKDLGGVYEALLELEPGISTEPMCRLRRDKLEVVVPASQGARYRTAAGAKNGKSGKNGKNGNGKSTVVWVEDIPNGRFHLRVGLGRKASGSYYTPRHFVRFLVQETLRPQVEARSPKDDPNPGALLSLKVLDPAMGSGHFLVDACRWLGEELYEACRLCDELATQAEALADVEAGRSDKQRNADRARAAELRRRVEALPDPDDKLVFYLPSRSREREEAGLSQRKALALCRRLVAVHCLYGVDKNPLAVELAKLALWLESYAEGLPLTFLDHRLVCGDSLTGPFLDHLFTYPGSGNPLDGMFAGPLRERLATAVQEALTQVRDLEASVGKDAADLEHKRAAKARLDTSLAPLKTLAEIWTGGVMLGAERCDDTGYEQCVKAATAHLDLGDVIAGNDVLTRMRKAGADSVPYDLVFPEVFWPAAHTQARHGFDVIVGNPPWDALQPLAKEFFASFDLRILDAPTRLERAEVEQRLRAEPEVEAAYEAYIAGFEAAKAVVARCYQRVNRQAGGAPSGAVTDVWQMFAERALRGANPDGYVGYVLPSAFHANQSATGIRELYLTEADLRACYSFENRKKLFDIHSSFKFATVVARRSAEGSGEFPCAFYLHDMEWLFSGSERLTYTLDFVRQTGGEYLSFLELQSARDAEVARRVFDGALSFGDVSATWAMRLGPEIDMAKGAHMFTPVDRVLAATSDPRDPTIATELRERGYLPLHEGKTFHQYDDRWEDRPRYLVGLDKLADKPAWVKAARYYRLAYRKIASSTNERTGILCVVPPGVVFGDGSPCERDPGARHGWAAMVVCAAGNSFAFDWCLRQKTAANVNLFILNGCPVPQEVANPGVPQTFLAHSALRLVSNHAGYAALWKEQLGTEWREAAGSRKRWPVVRGDDERWALRAAIDAVVAQAYGLSREQYEHLLSNFSHKSYLEAPRRCLAAFDELDRLGLKAFVRRYDPYWDVPLVDTVPEPVIDLPLQQLELPRAHGPRKAGASKGNGTGSDTRRSHNTGSRRGHQNPNSKRQRSVQSPSGHITTTSNTRSGAKAASDAQYIVDGRSYRGVVSLLQKQGALTSPMLQDRLGLDAPGVRPYLLRLVEEGLAQQEGQGRGTRYVWRGGGRR